MRQKRNEDKLGSLEDWKAGGAFRSGKEGLGVEYAFDVRLVNSIGSTGHPCFLPAAKIKDLETSLKSFCPVNSNI